MATRVSAVGAFFLVSAVASIAALPLSVYYARRQGQKRKLLVYRKYLAQFPLVSTRTLRDYQLSVVFQPEGEPEERVSAAYVHFVGFANLGREPIWKAEIAPAVPLRINVRGVRVLDLAVEAVHRPVSNISVDPTLDPSGGAVGLIDFDFLDYQDGALLRVVTTEPTEEISLVGEIVGMPEGIRDADELGRRSLWGKIGTVLVFAAFGSALAVTPFVVRWVTGGWSDTWILALPVVAVALPLAIVILVGVTIWPKGEMDFPRELLPRLRHMPAAIYMNRADWPAGRFEIDVATSTADREPSSPRDG